MDTLNLKNLPTTPLVIAGVVTLMGCIMLAGITYALVIPRSPQVAQADPTATRGYVTATPIVTPTPTATDTPTATETSLPTNAATNTPTRRPVTYVPPTAVPPTATPAPNYGADLGLDQLRYSLSMTTQGKGLTIPFFIKAHNSTNHRILFGYLGVAAQDSTGVSVAFRKVKINSFFEPDELFEAHDAIKIYKVGTFTTYFLICLSANDDACDQPGADYEVLAPPIQVTING